MYDNTNAAESFLVSADFQVVEVLLPNECVPWQYLPNMAEMPSLLQFTAVMEQGKIRRPLPPLPSQRPETGGGYKCDIIPSEPNSVPPLPSTPSNGLFVSSGDCGGNTCGPNPTTNRGNVRNVDTEAAPAPPASKDNSRGNLEASLSAALNRLLLQRRQYLSEDKDGDSDSSQQ
uniref:Uncharacterized protein n=1 Tax=Echinococcus granulosus TaxID=6210 RepID=A0A068WRY8_ECHGR|nr:hypothetical protein EgrG_001173300 [Echinococcus granulosus]